MTYPNPTIPRLSYAVSRRCARRCFFLRPSKVTNRTLGYCLGYALENYPSVRLTAFTFESSHYHLVLSDDQADLGAFFRDLNGLIARAMNTALGRGENFWSTDGVRRSGIFDEDGLWDQLVYCTLNPTKDGLVADPGDWPGLISLPEDVGTKTFRFERPEHFFRSEGGGVLPEAVEFELELPVELEDMDPEAFRAEYRARLDAKLAEVHAERAQAGKGFMGRRLILDQDPFTSAGDTFPDRGVNPRVVCKDAQRRRGVLRWLSEFRLAHKVAWVLWSHGQRDVLFPFGTYWMRVKYRVGCRDPVFFSGRETSVALAA